MSTVATVAVGAVAIVLLMGLYNMMRNGSANLRQQLMRWRVGLQFIAVLLLMLALFVSGR